MKKVPIPEEYGPVIVCNRCGTAVLESLGLHHYQCPLCGGEPGTRYTAEGGWIYHLIYYRAHLDAVAHMAIAAAILSMHMNSTCDTQRYIKITDVALAVDFQTSWTTFQERVHAHDSSQAEPLSPIGPLDSLL